ncbi:hypothetical protein [Streptomyces smyrnaeus]|uniref:hypothetical protein n=1 Tax=Streptomyces smyrnaeus TaxID=1387713 RepID=UPI00368C4847
MSATTSARLIRELEGFSNALRAESARRAALTPEERRAEDHARWISEQRHAESVKAYNAAVEQVNRERGRRANQRQAARIRAQICGKCFQVPAANGVCGCE